MSPAGLAVTLDQKLSAPMDAARFRVDAADRFTASMRSKVDLMRIYRRALRLLPETMDGQPPLPLPQTCPVTLDELLAEPP